MRKRKTCWIFVWGLFVSEREVGSDLFEVPDFFVAW